MQIKINNKQNDHNFIYYINRSALLHQYHALWFPEFSSLSLWLFIFNVNKALSANNIMCAHHINGRLLTVTTSCSFVAAYADPI